MRASSCVRCLLARLRLRVDLATETVVIVILRLLRIGVVTEDRSHTNLRRDAVQLMCWTRLSLLWNCLGDATARAANPGKFVLTWVVVFLGLKV